MNARVANTKAGSQPNQTSWKTRNNAAALEPIIAPARSGRRNNRDVWGLVNCRVAIAPPTHIRAKNRYDACQEKRSANSELQACAEAPKSRTVPAQLNPAIVSRHASQKAPAA